MKKRIARFLRALKEKKIDGFITANNANIKYLTGISQASGTLLFTAGQEAVYFTGPIYAKVTGLLPGLKVVVIQSKIAEKIAGEAKKLKLKKIGFSEEKMSINSYRKIAQKLNANNIKLIAAGLLVEKLRAIKEKNEINLIKKAAAISREALDYAFEISGPAMTEKALSIEIDRFLRIRADNQVSFPAIVASGKNTIFAHHCPNETRIGNFFLIDLGAAYRGYCADLTRVFFSDKMPTFFKKAYHTVRKAKSAAIKEIRDGKKASDIDKAARKVIEKQNLGKYFIHGAGHGIGLDVHEPPYLKPGGDEVLKESMVVTVEPAIYYKNQFGIRLEDMVIVKSKEAEVIS